MREKPSGKKREPEPPFRFGHKPELPGQGLSALPHKTQQAQAGQQHRVGFGFWNGSDGSLTEIQGCVKVSSGSNKRCVRPIAPDIAGKRQPLPIELHIVTSEREPGRIPSGHVGVYQDALEGVAGAVIKIRHAESVKAHRDCTAPKRRKKAARLRLVRPGPRAVREVIKVNKNAVRLNINEVSEWVGVIKSVDIRRAGLYSERGWRCCADLWSRAVRSIVSNCHGI